MKVVFAGPSIWRAAIEWNDVELRPPAAQGDLLTAVMEGASVIGLIDGYFGSTPSVWHKEILFALKQGVKVLGGASMGALRAAECAGYGMEAVGTIAMAYLNGEYDDDGMVALAHAPAELDYCPLSEPLVDALATFENLRALSLISTSELRRLTRTARSLFFQDRTVSEMITCIEPSRRGRVEAAYLEHQVSPKRADALAVIGRVRSLQPVRGPTAAWALNEPPIWSQLVQLRTKVQGAAVCMASTSDKRR